MGTTWSLRLANPDYQPMEPVQALVQQVLDAVIAQMSNWEADSAISQFNTSKPGQTQTLPAEFAHVLDAALLWAKLGSAMDPSMGRWSRSGALVRAKTLCSRMRPACLWLRILTACCSPVATAICSGMPTGASCCNRVDWSWTCAV